MRDDSIQRLIGAGAIPSNPFERSSRYHEVALGLCVRAGEVDVVPYVLRRFIPQRRTMSVGVEHTVASVDRPDSVAAAHLGAPELYWRVADANGVTDPFELTDVVGAVINVPVLGGF